MKIYTKTGDKGNTSLIGGKRVPKYHNRIEAYGTIDELNSYMGLIRDLIDDKNIKLIVSDIQSKLMHASSVLATETEEAQKKYAKIIEKDINTLEKEIDRMNNELPPLTKFILPGGHQTVSHCHIARTICRRAERNIVLVADKDYVDDIVVKYVNRLSDYLFTLARYMSNKLGADEIEWKP
jgi:cob(I)alamin adenosyltransferase